MQHRCWRAECSSDLLEQAFAGPGNAPWWGRLLVPCYHSKQQVMLRLSAHVCQWTPPSWSIEIAKQNLDTYNLVGSQELVASHHGVPLSWLGFTPSKIKVSLDYDCSWNRLCMRIHLKKKQLDCSQGSLPPSLPPTHPSFQFISAALQSDPIHCWSPH